MDAGGEMAESGPPKASLYFPKTIEGWTTLIASVCGILTFLFFLYSMLPSRSVTVRFRKESSALPPQIYTSVLSLLQKWRECEVTRTEEQQSVCKRAVS